MSHLVTTWTDTQANKRVSVAMILPSGINPSRTKDIDLKVSNDGMWLIVKTRVDTGLLNVYQCYHSYLTKPPARVHPQALDYHSKVCAHKRIVNDMFNSVSGTEMYDEHFIFLGRVCRRTLAGAGDGDTIFFGSTGVGPRKNGTIILHVELIVEEMAKRVTKQHKIGTSNKNYQHKEVNGDLVDVEEAEKNILLDRGLLDEESVVSVSRVENGGENEEKQSKNVTPSRNSTEE